MKRDSVEYLKFTLSDRDSKDITADVVQVAIVPHGSSTTPTWLDCTHLTGNTWRTTAPITFSAANYPGAQYGVVAKLTDSPEVPRADLGRLVIT